MCTTDYKVIVETKNRNRPSLSRGRELWETPERRRQRLSAAGRQQAGHLGIVVQVFVRPPPTLYGYHWNYCILHYIFPPEITLIPRRLVSCQPLSDPCALPCVSSIFAAPFIWATAPTGARLPNYRPWFCLLRPIVTGNVPRHRHTVSSE